MRDAAAFSDPLYTMPVDLHVHSTRSDGTFTPTQLVSMAKEKGLAAFALTCIHRCRQGYRGGSHPGD